MIGHQPPRARLRYWVAVPSGPCLSRLSARGVPASYNSPVFCPIFARCAGVRDAGWALGIPHTSMNPHSRPSISPAALSGSLWRHRHLVAQLTRREVVGRYKGSAMGLLWSFLNPVFMLAIYTFVFSVVFKARWSPADTGESTGQFALVLFVGLIVHGLVAEVLNRAPTLILGNVNFVKKVVFPLEILPAVALGSALFHGLVSLLVLAMALLAVHGAVPWTALYLPLILAPLLLMTLGLAWLLASLGVYLRDIGQTVALLTTVLMFVSPVFYPVDALPEAYRAYILANPLTFVIEQARAVLIWGDAPDWSGLGAYTLGAAGVAWAGFAWFQLTRRGFADVV